MNPDRWKVPAAHGVALWETASRGASYNPLSPSVIQNPYETYRKLQRHSPVHRSKILGSWVLTRYEDVVATVTDHGRFSNDPRWRGPNASVLRPAPDDYSILLMDPPDHSRLRKIAASVFARARLAALNGTIAHTAAELIDRAARRSIVDWVAEVAAPLSMSVMLRMLGIPEHDRHRWAKWVRERAPLLEMTVTRDERRTSYRAGAEIQRYFTALLRCRAGSDADDAISAFAREVVAGDAMSMAEAADMLSVLMIAGNETTANLIGNGMLALLRHPEQLQLLREEPARIQDAIDEMLRFDSPVQTDFRIAKVRATVRGHVIEPGDGVILLTGSANRDGAAFADPDTFDMARKGPWHTSFGHGIHYCVGAELARMEASAVFTEALRSVDAIKAHGNEPRYRRSTVIRGLAALPLRLSPKDHFPRSKTRCLDAG